jgi:hypothetical protein
MNIDDIHIGDWVYYRWGGLLCKGKVLDILREGVPNRSLSSVPMIRLEKYSGEDYCREITLDSIEVAYAKNEPETPIFKKDDMVNHPKHYTQGKYEVIEVLDDWFPTDPYEWQVVKYVSRAKHKGKQLEDLKKARWYLNRRITQLEKEK